MKTYAPKSLRGSDLRGLIADLVATPQEVAKFLHVTERSIFRWLAEDSAPRAVLCALWHETPRGREVCSLDVGNELVITRRLARGAQEAQALQVQQLARVLAIADFGAANDPLLDGPVLKQTALRGGCLFDGLGLHPGGGPGLETSGGVAAGCDREGFTDLARG